MSAHDQFPADNDDQRTDAELEELFMVERLASVEALLASTQALLAKREADVERLTLDLRDALEQRETARAHASDCRRERDMWRKSELALAAELSELRKLALQATHGATAEERAMAASVIVARLARGGPETESDLVEESA